MLIGRDGWVLSEQELWVRGPPELSQPAHAANSRIPPHRIVAALLALPQ